MNIANELQSSRFIIVRYLRVNILSADGEKENNITRSWVVYFQALPLLSAPPLFAIHVLIVNTMCYYPLFRNFNPLLLSLSQL